MSPRCRQVCGAPRTHEILISMHSPWPTWSSHIFTPTFCIHIICCCAVTVLQNVSTSLCLLTVSVRSVCLTPPFCVCAEGEVTFYHYGWKDCATIVFYFFIAIILHAVVQEYLLDVSISHTPSVGLVTLSAVFSREESARESRKYCSCLHWYGFCWKNCSIKRALISNTSLILKHFWLINLIAITASKQNKSCSIISDKSKCF